MGVQSYRESHLHKGLDYHDTFSSLPYRAVIWRLEQRLLLNIVRNHFFDEPPRYLDFACGTGRILGHLSPYCRSAAGVDVSASMLDVARRADTGIEIIEADITKTDKLNERIFDLITAFRFFPNAEWQLRKEALSVLARHLSGEGILVFNNHKNARSLRRRLSSMKRRAQGRTELARERRMMSDLDVGNLVAEAGLRIHRVFHMGVLPFADHMKWLPQTAITLIEGGLCHIPFAKPWAQNLIYVCRHLS